jgi:hypothetical protein
MHGVSMLEHKGNPLTFERQGILALQHLTPLYQKPDLIFRDGRRCEFQDPVAKRYQ